MSPVLTPVSDAAPQAPIASMPFENSGPENSAPESRAPESSAPESSARTRAEINRENAQHSTGPKTDEGKARIRLNALSHGLYSKTIVLPGEDLEAYTRIGESLAAQWNPLTEEERSLVPTLQETQWRISRTVALEFALFALTTEQQRPAIEERFQAEPGVIQALARAAAFQANARQFDQLSRLEARLHRQQEKAVRALNQLTGNRPPQPTPPEAAPERRASESAAPERRASVSPAPVSPALETRAPVSPAPETPATSQPAAPSGFVSPHPHGAQYPAEMPVFTGPLAKEKRRSWLRSNGYAHLAKRR